MGPGGRGQRAGESLCFHRVGEARAPLVSCKKVGLPGSAAMLFTEGSPEGRDQTEGVSMGRGSGRGSSGLRALSLGRISHRLAAWEQSENNLSVHTYPADTGCLMLP